MKKSLENLINEFYTKEQKTLVNEILQNDEKHLINYKILAVGLGDKLENLMDKELRDYYELEVYEWMVSEIDIVIANIITTLSKELNKDVRSEFEDLMSNDKNQPEFEYLLNETKKYLLMVMEMNKEDVLLFGLMLQADIFVDGIGTIKDDEMLYRNAALKIYGVSDESSEEEIETAEQALKEDVKELVKSFRNKIKTLQS